MQILLTGGAGYIGSHVALQLIDSGHQVFIIDNLSTGNESLIPKQANFLKCNINNSEAIQSIIKQNNFDAVMHFAAFIKVEESINEPGKYFANNTENSKKFFDICKRNNLSNIIFSSTASIYGNNKKNFVSEGDKINPINPYAESKLKVEEYILKNKDKFNSIILRYFNVAGADASLRSGLISKYPTHLIKLASEAAIGKRDRIIINGNDYNTPDGTPVRDYIHVSDLAELHIKSLEFLLKNKESQIFNCGYGIGYSVKDVLDSFNRISKIKINIEYGPRRKGDPESLVSDVKKLKQMINWKPKYNNLDLIIRNSIDWEMKLKNEKSL